MPADFISASARGKARLILKDMRRRDAEYAPLIFPGETKSIDAVEKLCARIGDEALAPKRRVSILRATQARIEAGGYGHLSRCKTNRYGNRARMTIFTHRVDLHPIENTDIDGQGITFSHSMYDAGKKSDVTAMVRMDSAHINLHAVARIFERSFGPPDFEEIFKLMITLGAVFRHSTQHAYSDINLPVGSVVLVGSMKHPQQEFFEAGTGRRISTVPSPFLDIRSAVQDDWLDGPARAQANAILALLREVSNGDGIREEAIAAIPFIPRRPDSILHAIEIAKRERDSSNRLGGAFC